MSVLYKYNVGANGQIHVSMEAQVKRAASLGLAPLTRHQHIKKQGRWDIQEGDVLAAAAHSSLLIVLNLRPDAALPAVGSACLQRTDKIN